MSHMTRTHFQGQKVKGNLQGAEGYCGGLPHSLFGLNDHAHPTKGRVQVVLCLLSDERGVQDTINGWTETEMQEAELVQHPLTCGQRCVAQNENFPEAL